MVATLVAAILALRADDRLRVGAYGLLAIVGAVVFAIGPYQLLPTDTAYWSPVEQVVGNAYILWGVAFLIVVWFPALPTRTGTRRGRLRGSGCRRIGALRLEGMSLGVLPVFFKSAA